MKALKRHKKPAETGGCIADYGEYRLSKPETIRYLFIFCLAAMLISYTFYDSAYAFFALSPMLILFFRVVRSELSDKRRRQLRRQFQDMIDSISSALSAGYSIENSFYESRKDMLRLYGRDSLIVCELDHFFARLEAGIPLEAILNDFALRAGVEDITDFSEIFVLAKRNGGNFREIIGKTVRIMKEKDETETEIGVILSGRKYEQRIMCVIPFGIILYLKFSSGSFLSVLYHNILGVCIMTACLIIYTGSCYFSKKITDIRV